MKVIAIIMALLLVGCFTLPAMASNDDSLECVEVATQYVKVVFATKEAFLSFKEGLEVNYDLNLHKLEANISTLGATDKGSYFLIGLQANLVAYCFDVYGLRIRVCAVAAIAVEIDKVLKKVVGMALVQTEAIKIIIGWEETDA